MMIALWIIAVCEVVRALQNAMQIRMVKHDAVNRENAYAEFVKSLKDDDRQFVKKCCWNLKSRKAVIRKRGA